MRSLVVDTLSACRYEVLGVADGAALLVELARNGNFHYGHVDLVLADIRMPLCSGLDVLDAFSAARVRPRFILMTAFPDDAIIARAAKLGVTVVGKPFGMARLCQLVERVLAEP